MVLTRLFVVTILYMWSLSAPVWSQTEKTRGKKSSGKAKSAGQPAILSRSTDAAVSFEQNKRRVDNAQPPYFGHRRPVKIRPNGKRKLCKTCGIVH
ncbi:MAG: hypothetical protein FJZ78_10425 [Bacteroidetes bacterium]|nr:hypothetical protein [Bacteroidota bacterium]